MLTNLLIYGSKKQKWLNNMKTKLKTNTIKPGNDFNTCMVSASVVINDEVLVTGIAFSFEYSNF